jgi:N-acetylglucosaminyldiphosphoundecaprenol N-acetyl-beta-D-mannosaminyltransferase
VGPRPLPARDLETVRDMDNSLWLEERESVKPGITGLWQILGRRSHYICLTNVNGIMECRRDETLRHIYKHGGLSTPDGVPLAWLSHLAGHHGVKRVYGPDFMLSFCERSTSIG